MLRGLVAEPEALIATLAVTANHRLARIVMVAFAAGYRHPAAFRLMRKNDAVRSPFGKQQESEDGGYDKPQISLIR